MERLEVLARRNGGFVTRAEASDAGCPPPTLARLVRQERLTRLSPGVYAPTAWFAGLGPGEQHRVAVRSVLAALGEDWAACHDSALVVHGIHDRRMDLDVVHVARIGGATSRRRSGVERHRESILPGAVTMVGGIRTVVAPIALAQTLTRSPLDAGAIIASHWLASVRSDARRRGRPEEFDPIEAKTPVAHALDAIGRRRGAPTARDALAVADGRCDSPAEVLVLLICWRYGLPRPELQYEIEIEPGRIVEVDFCWPRVRLVVEFDGMEKYTSAAENGDEDQGVDPKKVRAALRAEKQRQLLIADLDYDVVRLTWTDVLTENEARTAGRIERKLATAERRFVTSSDATFRRSR